MNNQGEQTQPDGGTGAAGGVEKPVFEYGRSRLYLTDCRDWLAAQPPHTVHGVVTDPPFGLVEYSEEQQRKMREGRGGVWRNPPEVGGSRRAPLPRFTTLSRQDRDKLRRFFTNWGRLLYPVLVPGAHVIVASNPLVSHLVLSALEDANFETRGTIVRRIQTLRGGDRPKNAHEEFPDVTVIPRSQWEPWLVARRPLEGRVVDNLRKYGTGGLRRLSDRRPFGDVIESSPASITERSMADHPTLKPQPFLREVVRAVLPLGEGVVADLFAGSGSTLAAAEAVGYESVGVESDAQYTTVAASAMPGLAALVTAHGATRTVAITQGTLPIRGV